MSCSFPNNSTVIFNGPLKVVRREQVQGYWQNLSATDQLFGTGPNLCSSVLPDEAIVFYRMEFSCMYQQSAIASVHGLCLKLHRRCFK
ncbi:hypothetical protein GUJ93_ZPchr0010g10746 [Zizania palustris]|uniref:Uncharacterized protein n=1 Tax=Zizania palustris TaxID=103762 RepID=A0A8J5VVQ6_ZIZPA|nr:hypothetical protein GUJ93_ZPchr0010g10746 [Zizania palustris]